VGAGTQDPLDDCQACQPAQSTSAYTTKPDGAACTSDNLSCTADVCTSGACTHPQEAGTCLIGGACHNPGDLDPADACQECTPGADPHAWSPVPGCIIDAGADASTDAGTSDAGTSDAGTSDAGTSDAGTSDAGTSDAGDDAGTSDAGTSDAGTSDAGTSDAGDDAGTSDAGTSDAGTSDAGTSDAGTSDAGDDAGMSDAGEDAGDDAGTSDAGEDAGTSTTPSPASGCGCRVTGISDQGSGMLVAALALTVAGARRRRRLGSSKLSAGA
jgi:MYXO-CTERM domain-containing protein